MSGDTPSSLPHSVQGPIQDQTFDVTLPTIGSYTDNTSRVHEALSRLYRASSENKDSSITCPLLLQLASILESEFQKLNHIINELNSRTDSQITSASEQNAADSQITSASEHKAADSQIKHFITVHISPDVSGKNSAAFFMRFQTTHKTGHCRQDSKRTVYRLAKITSGIVLKPFSKQLETMLGKPDYKWKPGNNCQASRSSAVDHPSNEVQGHNSFKTCEDYWNQCIQKWYPDLHSQTYFLPPIHFNRVPYSAKKIAGKEVLMLQSPRDAPSQASSTAKPATSKPPLKKHWRGAKYSISPQDSSTQGNLKSTQVYVSDARDDRALQRVLHGLRAMSDNNEPKEVMMVISQLQFGKYLGEPSHAAAAALLPRPCTLPENFRQQHYDEGNFDVLIIHRQHGLFTLEIKSVGDNFSELNMTMQQQDDSVMKKVTEAVKQLEKSAVVLKHLTSDLKPDINVTKSIALPYITSSHLLRAIKQNTSDTEAVIRMQYDARSLRCLGSQLSIILDSHQNSIERSDQNSEVLCQCLGVQSVDDAVNLCLLSDQLSNVEHNNHKFVGLWWHQLVSACGPHPLITLTVYEQLVARFCGPATTVEVHCVTAPRLAIRTLGEGVSEAGERMAKLALFPQQVDILNQSPPRIFLTGPPGTGKTVVLILSALKWLYRGYDVHVVSTWDESRSAAIIMEHQLKETTTSPTASSHLHRHQFNFRKYGEVQSAVRHLKRGGQMCLIIDEAINRQTLSAFCDGIIQEVNGVLVWGASVHHKARPSCLKEFKLTTPLRSPPVVVMEVKNARKIKSKEVHDYTVSDVPVPTYGPSVMRIKHRDGQLYHTREWPLDCDECGNQVARILKELNVGMTGYNNGPPPLQYRDVLVICLEYPTDDRAEREERESSSVSGLVRGLRASHVPVRVVKKNDEAAIRDTALGVGDRVTVTYYGDVYGLERKVVVVENKDHEWYQRLHAMSRCTSQLVLIDCSLL